MTRIGIFGGSFNPPHIAHQLAALWALETHCDEVWICPAYVHVFGKDLAPFDHRVEMCRLAAAALGPRASVHRAEEELAQRPGFVASRTLDLIEHVERAVPGASLRLLIGADILADTAKWYRWDEVSRRAPPLVIGRAGYPGGGPLELPAISSTRVRELVHRGDREAWDLVPGVVMSYIERHGLYR